MIRKPESLHSIRPIISVKVTQVINSKRYVSASLRPVLVYPRLLSQVVLSLRSYIQRAELQIGTNWVALSDCSVTEFDT